MTVIDVPTPRPTADINNGREDCTWITFYGDDHKFKDPPRDKYQTKIRLVDKDSLMACEEFTKPCVLNFASHRRPGGGYEAVKDLPMPIKTQEEDLFRRTDLPEQMDIKKVKSFYPLRGTEGFFTPMIAVLRDEYLQPCRGGTISMITVPAVVNPGTPDGGLESDHEMNMNDKQHMVVKRAQRVLDIAADHEVNDLILGAWGCGVFNNDPRWIAMLFKAMLERKFKGVFENVVFAIPGKTSRNYQIFKEVLGVSDE